MAELKTKPTTASVAEFLAAISDETRRRDCLTVAKIMEKATGAKPRMWGPTIVGFGDHTFRNARGQESAWFLTGFSPRKRDLTLYIMPGVERFKDLMKRLGKHKSGVGCLYIDRLDDVDIDVLEELVRRSVRELRSVP
jgi:uncharacterized protein DUF1801